MTAACACGRHCLKVERLVRGGVRLTCRSKHCRRIAEAPTLPLALEALKADDCRRGPGRSEDDAKWLKGYKQDLSRAHKP